MSQANNGKLYQPHFPESVGGGTIFGIRILKIADKKGWVLRVLDSVNKEAKAIAECKLFIGTHQGSFVTYSTNHGHLELCRLLRLKGIWGKYLKWLEEYEKGVEKPRSGRGTIEFECSRLNDENIDDWTIEPLPDPEWS